MSNQSRIRVLPDLVVNKIAAGEVVERPASVVKELVDNALDADATRIAVAIEDGGKQLIRVADDGGGMSDAELRLAVLPHATSKITCEDDLYTIATMGFRGEALASISAVSKLRIVSRPPDALAGFEVRVAGERFESARAAGCPAGTTVEVRDLFFNVPTRRKFLRANSTEVGHINEQLARCAVAYPQIGFELSNNGKITQNVPRGENRLGRIAGFFSAELADELLHTERDERGVRLDLYAAPPVRSRATAQWQYTYVNGRYIRDRYVQHAIKEAYRGLMEPHRHGIVFLFITIDPKDVDVNVHPTKIEVRWADSNLIHSQTLSALREMFQQAELTPALKTDRSRPWADPAEQDRIRREMASLMKNTAPIVGGKTSDWPPRSPGASSSSGSAGTSHRPFAEVTPGGSAGRREDAMQVWRSLYGPAPGRPGETDEPVPPGSAQPRSAGAPAGPRPRAIQLHNLYLVAETEDGIVIVDQHALHERVMYEQLCQRITTGPLESQRLLLPETVSATPSQVAVLETNVALLARLGIEVTRFGVDSIAIHSFPSLLKDTDVASFMRDLIDDLCQQPTGTSTEVVIHKALDMMACKAAVKAGDPLSEEEIEALMGQRHLIEKSSSCPHGRPTMLRLTRAELNRQFKRT